VNGISLIEDFNNQKIIDMPRVHAKAGRRHKARIQNIISAALKFHLELSLLKSNSASVGVLSPEDTSANFFPDCGTT
jgi:hypothetical protein